MEEPKEENISKRKCTTLFNILLTPLVLYQGFAVWLFENVDKTTSNISDLPWSHLPWNNIFPNSELVFGFFNIFVIIFLSPLIIMLIWNRLVAIYFQIKNITYAEAYTAFLGITFLTGLF
jgi:hypothetical protein